MMGEEDEEEEVCCRICRSGAEAGALFYPCKCSGSIRHVHQPCLVEWLKHSGHTHCEVCKHSFHFTPVYAKDAPARLPWSELIAGVMLRTCRGVRLIYRAWVVACAWLGLVPLLTSLVLRLAFADNMSHEAVNIIKSRATPLGIATDCFQGCLLSLVIVFVNIGVTSMREYLIACIRSFEHQLWHAAALEAAAVAAAAADVAAVAEAADVVAVADTAAAPAAAASTTQPATSAGTGAAHAKADLHEDVAVRADADGAAAQGAAAAAAAAAADAAPAGGPLPPALPVVAEIEARFVENHAQADADQAAAASLPPPPLPPVNLAEVTDTSAAVPSLSGERGLQPLASPATVAEASVPPVRLPLLAVEGDANQAAEAAAATVPHATEDAAGTAAAAAAPPPHPTGDAAGPAVAAAVAPAPPHPPHAAEADHAVIVRPEHPDASFEELIGLQGSWSAFIETISLVLAGNIMFVIAFVYLPLVIGRWVLDLWSVLPAPAALLAAAAAADPAAGAADSAAAADAALAAAAAVGGAAGAAAVWPASALWSLTSWAVAQVHVYVAPFAGLLAGAAAKLPEAGEAVAAAAAAAFDAAPDAAAAAASVALEVATAGGVLREEARPLHQVQVPGVALTLHAALKDLQAHMSPPSRRDMLSLCLGYGMLSIMSFLALWLFVCVRLWYSQRQLHRLSSRLQPGGRGQSFRYLMRAAAGWAGSLLYECSKNAQLCVLLLVEVGVFPVLCGMWLDVCVRPLMPPGVAVRVIMEEAPMLGLFLHWAEGATFMLAFTFIQFVTRDVLRPGALPFLKDPIDPVRSPLREMMEQPFVRHVGRLVVTGTVYAGLCVVFVHLPSLASRHLFPGLFPLRVLLFDPLTQIPADMLLFHICIPFIVEHLQARAILTVVIRAWLRVAGALLGIKDYLLLPQRGAPTAAAAAANVLPPLALLPPPPLPPAAPAPQHPALPAPDDDEAAEVQLELRARALVARVAANGVDEQAHEEAMHLILDKLTQLQAAATGSASDAAIAAAITVGATTAASGVDVLPPYTGFAGDGAAGGAAQFAAALDLLPRASLPAAHPLDSLSDSSSCGSPRSDDLTSAEAPLSAAIAVQSDSTRAHVSHAAPQGLNGEQNLQLPEPGVMCPEAVTQSSRRDAGGGLTALLAASSGAGSGPAAHLAAAAPQRRISGSWWGGTRSTEAASTSATHSVRTAPAATASAASDEITPAAMDGDEGLLAAAAAAAVAEAVAAAVAAAPASAAAPGVTADPSGPFIADARAAAGAAALARALGAASTSASRQHDSPPSQPQTQAPTDTTEAPPLSDDESPHSSSMQQQPHDNQAQPSSPQQQDSLLHPPPLPPQQPPQPPWLAAGAVRRAGQAAAVPLPPLSTFERQRFFHVKLLALGLMWAVSVAFLATMAFTLPILTGRALFEYVLRYPLKNDLYNGVSGFMGLWMAGRGALALRGATNTRSLLAGLKAALRWAQLVAKVVALAFLWLGVVALLLGVLIELVLLPLRLSPRETALISYYQDWVVGVLALKLWHLLLMLRRRNGGGGGGAAGHEENGWYAQLEALQNRGVRHVSFYRMLRFMILPAVMHLGTALSLPYVLSRGVLPLLPYLTAPALCYSALYAHTAAIGTFLSWQGAWALHAWIHQLHNKIRDDRYLVGRELNNFVGEQQQQQQRLLDAAAGQTLPHASPVATGPPNVEVAA